MWKDASSQCFDAYFFQVYVSTSFCLMEIKFVITQHIKVKKYISDLFH